MRYDNNYVNNLEGEKWTKDDDLQLVEMVLRNVRQGNSVIDGCREFEEATKGRRTADASKFRFHTRLKPQYAAGYELAKEEGQKARASKRRKINKGERMEQIMMNVLETENRPIVIDDIMVVLEMYKKQIEEQNLDGKREEAELKLRREKENLAKANRKLKAELKETKAELKMLIKEHKELKDALRVFQQLGIVSKPDEKQSYRVNKDGTIEKT